MNWKIVATLLVGALLVTACGAQPSAPANDATGSAAEPTGQAKPMDPGVQPAATNPSKDPAKKDVVMHE